MMTLFPIVSFDRIENALADKSLEDWGHFLGGCNRPFGRQSFGLFLRGELVAVAVSASTVNARCGGYKRHDVVELARLCAHPDHRDLTRVALRLWRVVAADEWGAKYWIVKVLVSYANAIRHKGDIYRFDGWKKVAEVRGGKTGPNAHWSRNKTYEAKVVWAFEAKKEPRGPSLRSR